MMIEDLSIFNVFIFKGEDRPIWKEKQKIVVYADVLS